MLFKSIKKASMLFSHETPTKIGTIDIDIILRREFTLNSEATQHPVETGFTISDHIILNPNTLHLEFGVTQTPITWIDMLGSGKDKIIKAKEAFEKIKTDRVPIVIITADKTYEDMVMTSFTGTESTEDKNMLKCSADFQHIIKVVTKTTEVPKDVADASVKEDAGKTEADGGSASTKETSYGDGGEGDDATDVTEGVKEDAPVAEDAQEAKEEREKTPLATLEDKIREMF